jgi:1-acyl-sn-glycerol-3-phosphate acyltransferase
LFYKVISRLLLPTAWWARLRVTGAEHLPAEGPVLLVPNHDSQWDPIAIGVAVRRRRALHFLARADLWKIPGLGPILYAIGQIPIERGARDSAALAKAIEALRAGRAVCIFPEGRLSRGESLRARTGIARLWDGCPEAEVVLCSIAGTTDYVRFPRRPRVSVDLFPPAGGQPRPGENHAQLAERLLAELRARVPPTLAGRGAAKMIRRPGPSAGGSRR